MSIESGQLWPSSPEWLFYELQLWVTPQEFLQLNAVCKSFRDSVYNTLQVLKLDRTVDDRIVGLMVLRYKSAMRVDLQFCSKISDQSLANIAALKSLRQLDLQGCHRLTDAGLANLVCHATIQQLDLRFCSAITDAGIPHLSSMTRLQALSLSGPYSTSRGLATLSSMTTLQLLDLDLRLISDPSRSLVQLAMLMQLRRLRLVHYPKFFAPQDIAPLAALTKLTSLCLEHCTGLVGDGQGLLMLSGLTLLQHVDLSHCWQLQDVGPLSHFRGLRCLNLRGCYSAGSHGFDALAPSLEELDLRECKCLIESSMCAVLRLPALRGLQLSGPLASTAAAGFSLIASPPLRELTLTNCGKAVTPHLSSLSQLAPTLQRLQLRGSYCLPDRLLQPLSHLTNLRSLDLAWCDLLRSLEPVSHMTALRELNLDNCPKLASSANMAYLAPLTLMRRLTLWGQPLPRTAPLPWGPPGSTLVHLSGMTGLQELVLGPSLHITNGDLALLGQFQALAHLNLAHCTAITDPGQLSGLVSLRRLVLSFCTGLSSECMMRLSGLRSLRSLEVAGLPGVSTYALSRVPTFHAAILRG